MSQTFKQWLESEYDHNQLADIANHGCVNGVPGMIYYRETYTLYQEFSASLHETLAAYKNETGEWPKYVTDELGDDVRFANALVWFAAEWLAQELTQGEYVEVL